MITGFSTKKIKSQKTLGEILKEEREKKSFSLVDAENATKVRAKYLCALENSRWSELPQEVYVRGFVLAYAKFLGLKDEEVIALYNKESRVHRKSEKTKISYNQSLKNQRVLITPKVLAYFALSSFVVFMFSYIIYQVLHFAGNPNLRIFSPGNNSILESDSVDLSGITDMDTFVVVNNENIPVTDDGHFQSKLKLHSGVNIIKVKAVNKAKKETMEVYTVEYKPKTAAIENTTNQ